MWTGGASCVKAVGVPLIVRVLAVVAIVKPAGSAPPLVVYVIDDRPLLLLAVIVCEYATPTMAMVGRTLFKRIDGLDPSV